MILPFYTAYAETPVRYVNGTPCFPADFASLEAAADTATVFLTSLDNPGYTDFAVFEVAGIYGPRFEVAFTFPITAALAA